MGLIRLQSRIWLRYPGTHLHRYPLHRCSCSPLCHQCFSTRSWRRCGRWGQLAHSSCMSCQTPSWRWVARPPEAASLWLGTHPQLSPSKQRNHCTDVTRQTASKNLPCCAETEQTLCILRQKLHQPRVTGPQRKGSAVGKPIGSGPRLGCQETL